MNWRWKMAQAAEIRWWASYLKNKPKAEYLDWKTSYWQNLLKQIDVEPKPDERTLDAGCGPAGIFTILKTQQVDALDPLLQEYEKNLPHFARSAYPNVRFFPQALETFSPETQYDTVFCLNAINHVADLDHSLDQLFKTIKKGGRLVLSIDAHNHAFFKHLFRLVPGDILHPHQYDLTEYQNMLTKRGARIDKCINLKSGFFFDYYILVSTFG